MIRLVGHGRLTLTTQALDDAATRISRYLLMQSAVNGVYGLSVGIGLWIIGASSAEGRFPNVLLWACSQRCCGSFPTSVRSLAGPCR